jgi:hypothetical protein
MNKIWGFGDSYTFGHGCRPDGPNPEYYHNYKKNQDKIWLDWLGSYMKMRPVNFGECGCSNDSIFDRIIENWHNIKKDDIVIIGITFHSRFDVPMQDQLSPFNWAHKYWLEHSKLPDHYKITQKEVETVIDFKYYFANHKLYKERQLKRFHFLEQLLKEKNIKYLIWDVNEYVEFDSIHTIKEDTDGLINDLHFSFKGHLNFADIIHKKITNNMSII